MASRKKPAEPASASAEQPVFKLAVNEARGEARLMIDDVELVLAAEMGRLAALSSRLECKSLNDLYARLSDVEVTATWAGVQFLTVRGNVEAALKKLQLRHFPACAKTFSEILSHQLKSESGNA